MATKTTYLLLLLKHSYFTYQSHPVASPSHLPRIPCFLPTLSQQQCPVRKDEFHPNNQDIGKTLVFKNTNNIKK